MPPQVRSRSGCMLCRLRRVKCDERAGNCKNCERASLVCPGYTFSPQTLPTTTRKLMEPRGTQLQHRTAAGTKRRRPRTACLECRRQKERCSGDRPACGRCLRIHKSCRYESESTKGASRSSNPLPLSTRDAVDSESYLPARETITRLWHVFFQYIASLQCLACIHRPTLLEELDSLPHTQSLDTTLWLSICALATTAASFDPELQKGHGWDQLGKAWFKRAHTALMVDYTDITVKRLLCLILLLEYSLRKGNHSEAFVMLGITARMTQALQLNLERRRDILCVSGEPDYMSALEAEIRRRAMWACYLADANMASGVDQLALIKPQDIKIQLPTHDYNFLHQIPAITERLEASDLSSGSSVASSESPASVRSNLGLQAYFIRMRYIKSRILSYIKKVLDFPSPWHSESPFMSFVKELDEFCANLPESITYSQKSIRLHQGTTELSAFLSLHLGIDQAYCDLYRLVIPAVCFPSYSTKTLMTDAPRTFITSIRDKLFGYAQHQSILLGDMVKLHDESAFADWGIGIHAHESVKYQAIYVMTTVHNDGSRKLAILEVLPYIEDSLLALQGLGRHYEEMASKYLISLFKLLIKCDFPAEIISRYMSRSSYSDSDSVDSVEPPRQDIVDKEQRAVDATLHPLSLFALVRRSLDPKEKHMPEKFPRGSLAGIINHDEQSGETSNLAIQEDSGLMEFINSVSLDLPSYFGDDPQAGQYDFNSYLGEFDASQLVFPGDYRTLI